jgi:hypothetical protein
MSFATHALHWHGRTIDVRREEGHDLGFILYTLEEWDDVLTADWEQRSDGAITFQGRPTNAVLAPLKESI